MKEDVIALYSISLAFFTQNDTLIEEVIKLRDIKISLPTEILDGYTPVIEESKLEFPPSIVEKLYNVTKNFLKNTRFNMEFDYNEHYKVYVTIFVDMDAGKAIEKWDRLVDLLKRTGIRIPIFINWLGKNDLKLEEIGYKIGNILAKMNIGLATENPINVTEIVEYLRN